MKLGIVQIEECDAGALVIDEFDKLRLRFLKIVGERAEYSADGAVISAEESIALHEEFNAGFDLRGSGYVLV